MRLPRRPQYEVPVWLRRALCVTAAACLLCLSAAVSVAQEVQGPERVPEATAQEPQAPAAPQVTPLADAQEPAPPAPQVLQSTTPAAPGLSDLPLPSADSVGSPRAGLSPGGRPARQPLTPLAERPPSGPEGPSADRRRGGIQGIFQRLDLFQGVVITGQNTITLQNNNVEGSRSAYQTQRWDTGSVVRQSSVHLEGPIWGPFQFQADISDSGWGTSYSRWIAGYMSDNTALLYGDLDMRLSGNEFLGFQKSTRGWQLDQRLPGGGLMRGFYTREKGVVRNQTFSGNDTPGPYYLTYTPVIEGSEVVKVNERYMKLGQDYKLDYDAGQLWFEGSDGKATIISASDTISVSYQSLGYLNQGPGELYGVRAEVPLLNERMWLGLTTLQQVSSGSTSAADTVGYQEDIYTGSGSTGPFDTNFRPIIADGTSVVYKGERKIIDKPLVVLVDGSEQVEGTDYDANRPIGRIIFRRVVPPTSLVIIKYYYDIRSTQKTGDKKLWGLDMAYQMARGTNLTVDWAHSGPDADSTGDALSTSLDMTRGKLHLLGEYRNIEPTFSYVDSVGFRKREKGVNLGGEWQATDNIGITFRRSQADSDTGLSFGYSGYSGYSGYNSYSGYASAAAASPQATTGFNISSVRNDLGIKFDFPNWPNLSFQHNTMSNVGGTSGNSSYSADAWNLDWSPRGTKLTFRASLNNTTQANVASATSTTGATRTGSHSRQFQGAVTYSPTQSLSLTASLSQNNSSAIETVNTSSSSNSQLSLNWRPSQNLTVDISHNASKSDGRVSSSYYSSTYSAAASQVWAALNPGGGGGGGGGGDDTTSERPSSVDSNDQLRINWSPGEKLQFDFTMGRRKYNSTGSQGYLADSVQDSWNLGASWTLSEALSLNLSLGEDNTDYVDPKQGAVHNRSTMVTGTYRPPGSRWTANLGLNIQSGSSPTFVGSGRLQRMKIVATKLTDLTGQLSYQLRRGVTITGSAGLSNYAGGYADFQKINAEVRTRFQLNDTTGVDFGYRFIRNISKLGADSMIYGTPSNGQDYLANTLLLSISTNFRGGIGASSGSGTGGPGTFGGYQGGLAGTGYGMGYGVGQSYKTGYGASKFDTLGTMRRQQTTFDPFATSGMGGMTSYVPSGGGKLSQGLGQFHKGGGTDRYTGPTAQAPPRPSGGGPARPATPGLEDWWTLNDGACYW